MIHLYDKSLTDKLKAVFGNVVYCSTDEALSRCEKSNESGVLKLPLISVYRISNEWTNDVNFNEMWQGRVNFEGTKRALSFSIDVIYQIDIWSSDRISCDGILCDLIFYILDNPNLVIEVPNYGTEDFSVRITGLDSDIDTSSFGETGRLYRNIITLESDISIFRSADTNYVNIEPNVESNVMIED